MAQQTTWTCALALAASLPTTALCSAQSCKDSSDCSDDQVCILPWGTCGSEPGYCGWPPDVCSGENIPLCGCDGFTYFSECAMWDKESGTLIPGAHFGHCNSDFQLDLGRGPVTVHAPAHANAQAPLPLVLLLHGYSATGAAQEAYMQFLPLVHELGFLYAYPDGTTNPLGAQFWNATDACCDYFGSGIDDSTYLRNLIDAIADHPNANVDPQRIYIVGHSNGGSMAYRMACDHSEIVAAIVSLAGATFLDPEVCSPAQPVHVLQIHGTDDAVALYEGGCAPAPLACYPGAVQSAEQWASISGCSLKPDLSMAPINLDWSIPGPETTIATYAEQCNPPNAGSSELWTIHGGAHVPALIIPNFGELVMQWLLQHPKPVSRPKTTPGDLDGDGSVGVADLLILLGAWGPCADPQPTGTCPADLDGNGVVGVSDLLTLLANWG